MDRSKLDRILLESRIAMLEVMALKLEVLLRTVISDCSQRESAQMSKEVLEAFAKQAESGAVTRKVATHLTDEEHALFADEYREMIDRLKDHLDHLFPAE